MKKIIKLMAALAAATLAFSCVEEAVPQTGNEADGSAVHDGPMTTIVFNVGDLETRTSYDKTNGHQWSDGDQIRIIWGEAAEESVAATVVGGKVSATVGDVDTYYAVYPEDVKYTLADGQLSVTIPRYQSGTFADANIMAATTSKETASFTFKNLTHIIKFTLSEGHGYNTIEFCPNSEVRVNGMYSVDLETTTLNYKENNSKYVTLNTVSGKSGEFYVGIEPEADMSTGIAVHARKNGDSSYRYFALSKNGITTTRSAITPLGPIDEYLRENTWYITKEGNGDGSSWSNAAGITKLIELMNKIQLNETTTTNKIHQWRLSDAEIHIAAGEYDIPGANGGTNFTPSGLTEYCSIKIIGGYSSKPTEGETPVIGDEGSATVLSTSNQTTNSRVFYFNGTTFRSLTFEGISFKKNNANTVGFIDFRNAAQGNVTFNDCYISVQTTNNNAGIIRIVSNTSGLLNANFNNCRFVNNSGESLLTGALYVDGDVTVAINNCIFDGNSAINCADIEYNNNAKIFINRTYFKNGKTSVNTVDKWFGSAISNPTPGDNAHLCMNNSIIYNYTNAGTSRIQPVIFNQKRHHLINSTICSSCTQVLRLTGADSDIDLNINNVVVNTNTSGNGSIIQSGSNNKSDFNVLQLATKGNNQSARENETVLTSPDDITFTWDDKEYLLTWSLNELSLKANTTKENIATITATNYPDFDTWLKTVDTDPYGIDYYGNKRNAEKLNPGAWDEGL